MAGALLQPGQQFGQGLPWQSARLSSCGCWAAASLQCPLLNPPTCAAPLPAALPCLIYSARPGPTPTRPDPLQLGRLLKGREGMLYFVFNRDVIAVVVAHNIDNGEFVAQVGGAGAGAGAG